MHSTCRLSRRWHQQFCRSPNFVGHQHCLNVLQPLRAYRQQTRARTPRTLPSRVERHDGNSPAKINPPPRSNIVVREYEPDPYDQSKLHRVEPNQEISEEMAETRMEMMRLDQELASMRQGPFGPQSKFMQSFPQDEREQLLQALTKEGILTGEHEDLLTMAELENLADEGEKERATQPRRLGVTLRIPKKDQAYIRHFNEALQAAEEASGVNVQLNLTLWRWYLRCQQQVHNFSTIVPEDVWQFLWQSQAELKVRPKHLIMLTKDMLDAELALDPRQWLTYIESLHADGDTSTAIKTWENKKSSLRAEPQISGASWEIGVKMYADIGRPLKAQELAFNALKIGRTDSHILIPVIVAWAKSQAPDALVKAWACYLRLRQEAGNTMLLRAYEQISNAFLDNNHGDMALSVFKDMLLMEKESSFDSREVYKQATKRFDELLQRAPTEEQVNRIGLSALLVLPRQLQNRFFFTSWIKKLIGEKRVDSASMVVELMYERGIAPDAKPLNGIIGAWLREGSTSAQRKAESMAWSMIQARTDLVARRNASSSKEGELYRKIIVDDRDQSVQRKIPPATIETFSILLQHYTRRQDAAQAEKLTNTMVNACQIRPNSYIMNHWLYGDLRAGRLQVVWDKYCSLKQDITPDLETFAALWDTAKAQLSKANVAHANSFPSVRELFAEMKDWTNALSPRKAAIAKEDFSDELYEQVIRCFCLSKDLPGTLLAIHHLSHMFDTFPTDNAVRLVCGQAARLLPQEASSGTRASRTRQSVRQKSVMSQIAEVIETIETKRKIALADQGVDFQAISDPQSAVAQQLRLAVLNEFICLFMQKAQAETGSYRNDVKIAARTMHVDLEGIDLDLAD